MKRWHKIFMGTGFAIIALFCLGALALSGFRSWAYPTAAHMPAIVHEPMTEILERLEKDLQTNAPPVSALLQPGLSTSRITELGIQYGVHLPADICLIYQWHNGSRFTTNYVSKYFIPGERFLPLDEALAQREAALGQVARATLWQRLCFRFFTGHMDSWICLFDDGGGNGYFFDPKQEPEKGAIFFHDNEDASYVFFPSSKNLMAGTAKCYEQGAFHLKAGVSPPQLDEDYEMSGKIWNEFGASNNSN